MKKCWNIVLFAAVFICLVLLTAPDAKAATSGYYTFEVVEGEAVITDCNTAISGSIAVPDKLYFNYSYYPVTAIGDDAFASCSSIDNILIPEGVKTIGERAFSGCSGMLAIQFPESLKSIGAWAFYNCSSLQIVDLPPALVSVGDHAFYYCSNLLNVTAPETIESFGQLAFYGCDRLVYMTYDNGLYIGNDSDIYSVFVSAADTSITSCTVHPTTKCIAGYGFYQCTSLTSVSLPTGLRGIGFGALSSCTKLTSVTLPNGLKRIEDYAFAHNNALTNISIPDSIRFVSATAFFGSNNLRYTNYANEKFLGNSSNPYAVLVTTSSDSLTYTSIQASTKCIAQKAYDNCTELKSVVVPGTVEGIGEGAFSGCSALSSLTLPYLGTELGSGEPFGIIFGTSSYTGGTAATQNGTDYYIPTSLTEVTIKGGTIIPYAFSGCNSLAKIVVDGPSAIGHHAFFNLTGLKSVVINAGVTTIGNHAFYGCSGITSIYLPVGLTTVGDFAFARCTSLGYLSLGNSLTTVGNEAFNGCTKLQDVRIPGTLNRIADSIFYGCSALKSVTIDEGVNSIGRYAFANCYNLTGLHFPASLRIIDSNAFAICGIKEITVSEDNPYYNSIDGVLFNEDGTKLVYAGARVGKYTVPDGVVTIGFGAFQNALSMQEVTLPVSLKTVESDAFGYSSHISNVYYLGTQEQWENVSVSWGNNALTYATLHIHEHSFTNYVSNGDATCEQDGTKTALCDGCNVTDTQPDENSALGHSFTKYVVINPATCTVDAIESAKCDNCDVTDVRVVTGSAPGHQWDAGVYYPPTLKNQGYTVYTCTVCGETNTVVDVANEIVSQPVSASVDSGNTVVFRVEATGNIASYRWQYRKIYKWFDTTMEGFDTNTLTVPATGARNGYDYRCVITFTDGTVLISDTAELKVTTYLTITSHPNDQVAVLGVKGQFTAAAEGEGLVYQWQYQRPGSDLWIDTAMEGATKPTVMIETNTARDGYKYRCEITDVTGNVAYTEAATMRVLYFTAHPVEVFTGPDVIAEFTVETTVEEGFTYQWQYSKNGTTWSNTTMVGYNTNTLQVSATKARNGYQYRCVLTGAKNGKLISKAAVMHVGDPVVIEDQSVSCTVSAGKTVLFNVTAANVYTYQWQYQRPNVERWTNTTMEGAATDTLTVQATSARNGYKYRCVMMGLDGKQVISQPITLTVK